MKLEINDSYIDWIIRHNPEIKEEKDIQEYVNEVLSQHQSSWEELDD